MCGMPSLLMKSVRCSISTSPHSVCSLALLVNWVSMQRTSGTRTHTWSNRRSCEFWIVPHEVRRALLSLTLSPKIVPLVMHKGIPGVCIYLYFGVIGQASLHCKCWLE